MPNFSYGCDLMTELLGYYLSMTSLYFVSKGIFCLFSLGLSLSLTSLSVYYWRPIVIFVHLLCVYVLNYRCSLAIILYKGYLYPAAPYQYELY